MYQFAYDEIIEDSSVEARDREVAAFNEANRLLDVIIRGSATSQETHLALRFNEELWMILVEDLAHPDNKWPDATRASLISIGIWVIKEIERIRRGQSSGFRAIADINAIIRDGLN
jgi:flagellar protein FlaF